MCKYNLITTLTKCYKEWTEKDFYVNAFASLIFSARMALS